MFKKVFKRILGQRGMILVRRIGSRVHDIQHIPIIRFQWILLKIAKSFGRPLADAHLTELPGTKDTPTALSRKSAANLPSRPKRHVLFVTEKWCDANPDYGLSNNTHNLLGSLEASGLATHSQFCYDEYRSRNSRACDSAC